AGVAPPARAASADGGGPLEEPERPLRAVVADARAPALLGPPGRPAGAGEAALLPDGPAAGPGEAAAVGPSAHLVRDQPRELGRSPAGADRAGPAAGDARLAPLGRPARDRRGGRAGVRPAPRELPGVLPAGRALRRERDALGRRAEGPERR